jgi:hypothetical protein
MEGKRGKEREGDRERDRDQVKSRAVTTNTNNLPMFRNFVDIQKAEQSKSCRTTPKISVCLKYFAA